MELQICISVGEKLVFLKENLEPRKTKSNLCPSELADDKTNYDSQTQDTEPGKTSRRKRNSGISANSANVLTTAASRLAYLNKENELSDKIHVHETIKSDVKVL